MTTISLLLSLLYFYFYAHVPGCHFCTIDVCDFLHADLIESIFAHFISLLKLSFFQIFGFLYLIFATASNFSLCFG